MNKFYLVLALLFALSACSVGQKCTYTQEGTTELSDYSAVTVWFNGTDDVSYNSFVAIVRTGEDYISVYFFNGTNQDNAAGYMNANTDVYVGGTYIAAP